MNENIEKIKKITQAIETSNNLLDFDHIELPFELLNTIISLLDHTFSDVSLNFLGTQYPETLDAWAIALHQSLPNQLTLLNRWQNYLNNLTDDVSIPSKLREKIDNKIEQIEQINQQKSQLNQQYEELITQEEYLTKNNQQLIDLQRKIQELIILEKQLKGTDLEQLKEEVRIKQESIVPKQEKLEKLTKEKKEVENFILDLHKLEKELQIENEFVTHSQGKLENKTIKITKELIDKIQVKYNKISENLTNILQELSEQQSEYQTIKEQLETAVQNFNQYQIKTQEIKHHLEIHYQYNSELMGLLPVDRGETDNLIKEIKEKLGQLDQELAKAQKNHEISQQKLNITF